jgi:hypothetical protein
MAKSKMNLGGAGMNDSNRADTRHGIKREKVSNVVPRPNNFPNKIGVEPIGSMPASPLQMKGMKSGGE